MPNSELVSKEVLNFGRPAGMHRMTVRIGFHYRHPPNHVRRVLLAAVRDTPGVVSQPPPDCGPVDFGESAIVYALRYWITDFGRDSTIDEEVRARLWYAAQRAGLEIPFPIRTLVSPHDAAGARAATEAHEQSEALRLVAAVEPLGRLDDESRRRSARAMRRLAFAPGEHIVPPEEPCDALYAIASGEVAVKGTGGEVATLGAGQLLGQRVLPAGDGSAPVCTARSEVVLYRIDDGTLEELLAGHPALAAGLAAIAAARQAALDPRAGRSSASAPEPAAGLVPRIQRLFRS